MRIKSKLVICFAVLLLINSCTYIAYRFQEKKRLEETPRLEIKKLEIEDIFSSLYKYYSHSPLGEIVIKNTTGVKIDELSVSIFLKEIMDHPTESQKYFALEPEAKITVKLYPVFNPNILKNREDSVISAQIKIQYGIGKNKYELNNQQNVNLYNRNALTWDEAERVSVFITPQDPLVQQFSRRIVSQQSAFDQGGGSQKLAAAVQLFNALGIYGIKYVQDPNLTFRQAYRQKKKTDYVQFPKDLLKIKAGDCDDLAVLMSALLESVGIQTAIVILPTHVFVMLDTEIPAEQKSLVSVDDKLVIIRNQTVWIPVETTLIGKRFVEAWEMAASQYYKDNPLVIELRKAWKIYIPPALEEEKWEPAWPQQEQFAKLVAEDLQAIADREWARKKIKIEEELKLEPANSQLWNKLAVTYARYGKPMDSLSFFQKALELDPGNKSAYFNLGNAYFLLQDYPNALINYENALKFGPNDLEVKLQIAEIYKETKQESKYIEIMKELSIAEESGKKSQESQKDKTKKGESQKKLAQELPWRIP